METINRFLSPPNSSFFLFGPRGTGKSTWIQSHYRNALFIDLLDDAMFRQLSAKPERLGEIVEGETPNFVVIDEVQKIPSLLGTVHQLMERHKKIQFILTGSSSRKLKRSGVDLLAGRAQVQTLHPFMASELGGAFQFTSALQHGLIPLVMGSQVPEKTLHAYISLYLKEEVQAEGLVRNLGNFSRFLETISFSHGSVINISHISRECQVERKTAEGYLHILHDLLLSFEVPIFSKRAKRQLIAHSKFYYFDAGVYRTLRPKGPLDRAEEIDGQALEGLVAQHLRAWNAYSGDTHTLSYWRTPSGTEVDFVVYGEKNFVALEVKNTKRISEGDLKGLFAFLSDYPEATGIFLYRGHEKVKIKNVRCLPVEDFLKSIHPKRSLS